MTVISLSGASGVGKSTLEEALAAYFGGGLVTRTTSRLLRPHELAHEYMPAEALCVLHKREACVLPPVLIHDNWYATREIAFTAALLETNGRFAIQTVTPERHQVLRDFFQPRGIRTVAIHLLSPSEAELRKRLAGRGWSAEEIEHRIIDSRHFDEWARSIEGIHFIEPGPKSLVYAQALTLYLNAH